MTSLNRVVVEWGGSPIVGRACSVLHYSASDNAAPPVAAIASAFESFKSCIAAGVTITVPGSGDVINDVDGSLVGSWTATAPPVVTATGSFVPAAGVGACVSWNTGGIVPGTKGPRRLRGRTFLVPLSSGMYQSNGTLLDANISLINAWASSIMGAGPLAVWHRPNAAAGIVGNSYGVQSFRVRDKVAYLSSRRD